MRIAQIVMGPAGSGKLFNEFCEENGRVCHVVNLDPAAEEFEYPAAFDIRELISVTDAMEELDYGPNGALMFCMEYLLRDTSWLETKIGEYEDDYIVFDCPGQIELYSHVPIMTTFTALLQKAGFRCMAVYLIDSHFITDISKFFSGCLSCLSAMMALGLPHINVLSKSDMIGSRAENLEMFLDPDFEFLLEQLDASATLDKRRGLNRAIAQLLGDYSMVSFVTLSKFDEQSVADIVYRIDQATQYDEDREVKVPKDDAE